jgi:succinyl-diaminopimelate desuccinylase
MINRGGEHDVLTAAKKDHDSVVKLVCDLVAIPSRGGIDSYGPTLEHVEAWLAAHGLTATTVRDSTGAAVALTCEIVGTQPGPRWVLDACPVRRPRRLEPPAHLGTHRRRLALGTR